jgi:gliding motility-associated-like protein
MKKILLFLLFLTFSTKIFAQLDREHWFAPMFDGQSNPSGYEQFLHLSTNETTPFMVDIYSNNVLVAQKTISKGSPGVVEILREYIITDDEFEINKVGTKGLYVKGERPLFANLRFGVTNHAEIITSKGTAGIGKEFYTVMAPNEQTSLYYGSSASFLATEDNTAVTISDFKKSLYFSGLGSPSSISFILNKGQSYIADVRTINSTNNRDGFIGAKVVADKPISMTNGNFNGQYASAFADGSDILMDQSVPVDKLGDEFVIVKGYGKISNNMEGAIIVATEKNTSIYLNDATVPIKILANAGDNYRVSENDYQNRGNDHYNIHISTDKNVYVYQLLGGVETGASPLATGGMNYIPPLNCYLPRKIDEISYINKIRENDPDNRFITKLNIITEKGASVKVNGVVPNAIYGPYDVSNIAANQNWVSYSIPKVTGNITVESDKSVTAGIASGNGAFGYGGYFAGFSSIPLILKTQGDCISGAVEVKLEITEGFDMYQWEIKNNAGVFVNAPTKPGVSASTGLPYRNNEFIYYPSQAGIYRARIKQGSCDEIITKEFKFYNCTTYTNVDYETCSEIPDITPAFSLSTQAVNPGTVVITEPAKKGLAELLPNGKIKYTANPGESGIDTFRFSYCGTDAIPDCETAQATIQINQIVGKDAVLRECTSNNTATYDLREADVTADTAVSKVFYKSLPGAQNQTVSDVINNFDAYPSADTSVYVRMVNGKTCVAIQKIELKSKPYPVVKENLYTKVHCDEEDTVLDGNYVLNPNDITPVVFTGGPTFSVKYYDSLVKAEAGGADFVTGNYVFTATTAKIWIRVESADVCATVKEIILKVGNKIPLLTDNLNEDVCDKSFDDTEVVDLSKYLPKLTAQTGLTVLYYATMPDALSSQNAISASQTINRGTVATFYYVIKNANFCSDVATVNLTLIDGGFASSTILPAVVICEGSTIQVDAGTAHVAPYIWVDENDPSRVIPSTQKVTLGVGKYHVILTSANGCEYKQNFEITGSPKAQLDVTKFNAVICDDNMDGKVDVKFSTQVTPLILLNPHSDLKVEYYNGSQLLGDNFSYQTDTRISVKVVSKYCTDVTGFIDFKIGNKITLINTIQQKEECDGDLDGKFLVKNLDQYRSLFTNDASATVKFFVKKTDAQNPNATNNVNEIDVNEQQLLHVRVSNGTDCPVLAELTIKIKVPVKSDNLKDKTICPDELTDLDAETGLGGFTYEWYKEGDVKIGAGNYISGLPVGKYYVILQGPYPNDCPYKQNVEIKAAELPIIDGIEITGSTVKIIAKNGTQPYRYAIDGGNYQNSDTFTNVSPGLHKAYVISADNCDPVEKEFSVIEIYNLLTPNGDGVNDVLDMSLLKHKVNVKFQVMNRDGQKLFDGDTKNNYIWDGKQNGKVLPTSTYWYIMQWQDFDNSPPVKYTGWILLKNRNTD